MFLVASPNRCEVEEVVSVLGGTKVLGRSARAPEDLTERVREGLPFASLAAEEKAPLVIAMPGFDSTAEELYFIVGAAAVARGYHCLLFEGPGQGMGQPTRDAHFPAGFNTSYVIGRREGRLSHSSLGDWLYLSRKGKGQTDILKESMAIEYLLFDSFNDLQVMDYPLW